MAEQTGHRNVPATHVNRAALVAWLEERIREQGAEKRRANEVEDTITFICCEERIDTYKIVRRRLIAGDFAQFEG